MEIEFKKFCARVRSSRVGMRKSERYPDELRQEVVVWASRVSVGAVSRGTGVALACIYRWQDDFSNSNFDDTGVVILSLREGIRAKQEQALAQGKNPDSVRSGLHTSVTCAVLPEMGRIVLFNSGLHHFGEIVGKLLEKRTA